MCTLHRPNANANKTYVLLRSIVERKGRNTDGRGGRDDPDTASGLTSARVATGSRGESSAQATPAAVVRRFSCVKQTLATAASGGAGIARARVHTRAEDRCDR